MSQQNVIKARSVLPLKRLMEQYGDGPSNGKWKGFACPFCQKKGASVSEFNGREWFKCWHVSCPSGTSGEKTAWDEVGYLMFKLRVPRPEGFIQWLKQAGVWREQDPLPSSVMPGKAGRRKQRPEEPPEMEASPEEIAAAFPEAYHGDTESTEGDVARRDAEAQSGEGDVSQKHAKDAKVEGKSEFDEDEDLFQQCVEVIRSEQRASCSLLQRRLRLGYARALRILDEMEKRGFVGPHNGNEPRVILMDLGKEVGSTESHPPGEDKKNFTGEPDMTRGGESVGKSPDGTVPPSSGDALQVPGPAGPASVPLEGSAPVSTGADSGTGVPANALDARERSDPPSPADAGLRTTGAPRSDWLRELTEAELTLLKDAVMAVVMDGFGSTLFLQRKFNLGWKKAKALIDRLELLKCVSPAEGPTPRAVLWDEEMARGFVEGDFSQKPTKETKGEGEVGDVKALGGGDEKRQGAAAVQGASDAQGKSDAEVKAIAKVIVGAFQSGGGDGGKKDGGDGGSGGGSGGGGEGGGSDEPDEAVKVLREFYARLTWSAADELKMWRDRGLTAETCRAAGFRSSSKENLKILEELGAKYSAETMVSAGLYVSPGDPEEFGGGQRTPRPNAQFYGFGIQRKKTKAERERDARRDSWDGQKKPDDFVWGWTNPVLIPYFNAKGELILLRPHKGFVKQQNPQPFFVREIGKVETVLTRAEAIVTEGEFKAWALWQVLVGTEGVNRTLPVRIVALPGITQAKNWFVQYEFLDWLESENVRRVVVAYDNEEKGDPKLESYKEEFKKRHDTEAWARYLAHLVDREGYDGRVCVLPVEWRDSKGKADWDGVLRMLVSREVERLGGTTAVVGKALDARERSDAPRSGEAGSSSSVVGDVKAAGDGDEKRQGSGAVQGASDARGKECRVIWRAVAGVVREEFLRVIGTAQGIERLRERTLFDNGIERVIKERLEHFAYEPMLPYGGLNERAMASRIGQYMRELRGLPEAEFPGLLKGYLIGVIKGYKAVKGRYYKLNIPTEGPMKLFRKIKSNAWNEREDRGMKKLAFLADMAIKGTPESVSNFYMKVFFVVEKGDGTRDKMVRLYNVEGEKSPLVALDAHSFAQPTKFREWLGNQKNGNCSWGTGEKELQRLSFDVDHFAAYQNVTEVNIYGHHAESGIWFFQDGARPPGSNVILKKDTNGVYWWKGIGYLLSETDREGQSFRQGLPKMNWDWKLQANGSATSFELFGSKKATGVAAHALDARERSDAPRSEGESSVVVGSKKKETDEEVLGRFFRVASEKLRDAVGGYDAYMALGSFLSFGAAPEIFQRLSGFPGVFIHGEARGGKSTIGRFLMKIWGFRGDAGFPLNACSQAGMGITLQQYPNLPVWFEELRPDTEPPKIHILRNMFGRESGQKKEIGEGTRKVMTAALVTGEHTIKDPATRSRFPHIHIAKSRRVGTDEEQAERLEWLERHARLFVLFGRFVMLRREEFAKHALEFLEGWLRLDSMRGVDGRAREVHGVAYAGFMAMVRLLESHYPEDLKGFLPTLIQACVASATEIKSEVNVELFWNHVLSCYQNDGFGDTPSEIKKLFHVKTTRLAHPPLAPDQGPWNSYELYFLPQAVLERISAHLRKSGMNFVMSKSDLFTQMSTRPYWIGKPGNKKFGFGEHPQRCWGVALDLFEELGYTYADAEDVDRSRLEAGVNTEEWADPRKGALYTLVERLTKVEREEEARQGRFV